MELLSGQITPLLRRIYPEVVSIRRDLHSHPELSEEETRTAAEVASYLEVHDLEVHTGIGGHGVVALLHGGRPGPVVAYRADMDALPIQEQIDAPYSSLTLGVSHACGHDANVAIALGVAGLLSALRDRLAGTVKFIFQPAEESLSGAEAMIADGALLAPMPEAILGLHMSSMPVGQVGVALGCGLAGAEEFRVSFPEPAGDLDELESELQNALQSLRTESAPTTPSQYAAVLHAMETSDRYCRTVYVSAWPGVSRKAGRIELLGLISVTDLTMLDGVRARIREVLDSMLGERGRDYELQTTFLTPPLVNDPALVGRLLPVLEAVAGAERVHRFRSPFPFSHEDFALFADRVPAVFLFLGSANPEAGIPSILHTPDYDIDEQVLGLGVSWMSALLLSSSQWVTDRP